MQYPNNGRDERSSLIQGSENTSEVEARGRSGQSGGGRRNKKREPDSDDDANLSDDDDQSAARMPQSQYSRSSIGDYTSQGQSQTRGRRGKKKRRGGGAMDRVSEGSEEDDDETEIPGAQRQSNRGDDGKSRQKYLIQNQIQQRRARDANIVDKYGVNGYFRVLMRDSQDRSLIKVDDNAESVSHLL